MIRPHLRELPAMPLPVGFCLRPIQPDEGTAWEDLWNACDPYTRVKPGTFDANFGQDPAAIPQRCFFLCAPDGRLIGTMSAWYNRDFRGQEIGRIHWLAVLGAFRGRGLGAAGLAAMLRKLARWHRSAYLITETKRLPAIMLYLRFGFEPAPADDAETAAWWWVAEQLDHPLLAAYRA